MPLRKLHIVLSIMALGSGTFLSAQSPVDSLSRLSKDTTRVKPVENLYRPQIEAGVGVLSYFGDVGNLGGSGRTSAMNWGYSLAVKNRISNSFGLDIFAMFGKVSGQEDFPGGDANFETPIRMGGISVNYNFNALLPKERNITPYISLGIATFEFDPKGDKYDSNGNKYHYWNDGTIRSEPENIEKANEAVILRRDGVYETDLREMNADRSERYALRAFSIPVGAGVGLKVTNSFTVSMGATFHFALSDNIDNINSDDQTYANTKKGNDYMLYSNIGIAYDLQYRKKPTPKNSSLNTDDFPNLEYDDEDKDGIADIIDLCPFTPAGVKTDMYGCPTDSDMDGVADYVDLELNTAKGAVVNADGVTLTDQDFENMYLTYSDSVGNLHFDKSQTFTADVTRYKSTKRNKGYRIEFKNTSNMDGESISKLLSQSDIQSEESDNGTVYYIGEFESLDLVLARQAQLQDDEFKTRIVFDKFGNIQSVDEDEIAMLLDAIDPTATNFGGVTFRVQIGAYRYKLSKNVFTDVPNLLTIQGDDGLTRYVSGSYTNLKDAAEHKIDLLLKGFDGAFVTAYQKGKRITLKAAGATMTGEEDISTPKESESINKDFVKFTIQLGSFKGRVPADVLSQFMTLGNVRPLRGSNGTTKYVYGIFNSQNIANAKRRELTTQGFKDAVVVGEFNGQVINADEANEIKMD